MALIKIARRDVAKGLAAAPWSLGRKVVPNDAIVRVSFNVTIPTGPHDWDLIDDRFPVMITSDPDYDPSNPSDFEMAECFGGTVFNHNSGNMCDLPDEDSNFELDGSVGTYDIAVCAGNSVVVGIIRHYEDGLLKATGNITVGAGLSVDSTGVVLFASIGASVDIAGDLGSVRLFSVSVPICGTWPGASGTNAIVQNDCDSEAWIDTFGDDDEVDVCIRQYIRSLPIGGSADLTLICP